MTNQEIAIADATRIGLSATGAPRGYECILPILVNWHGKDIESLNAAAFAVGQAVGAKQVARSTAEHQLRVGARVRGYFGKMSPQDISCAIELQLSAGMLYPAVQAANDNERERLAIIEACDLAHQPLIARQFVVERLIPDRTVTLLSGDGGVGKGAFTMQLLASVALGVPFFGLQVARTRSLYCGAEDELGDLHIRLARIAAHMNRPLSDFRDVFLLPMAEQEPLLAVPAKRGDRLAGTHLLNQIREEVIIRRIEFLVLDASADVFGGDEVDRAQVRQFVGMLRKLAIDCGCAILLIAHPSVQGIVSGSGLSGSTAWNNSVRSRLYMDCGEKDADPQVRRVRLLKSNYAESGLELMLRWDDGILVPDSGDDSAAATLLSNRADELFLELLTLLNGQDQNVSASPGSTYAPTLMARHPKAKGFTKKALAAAMQRLFDKNVIRIATFGPPSRQRRRIVRVTSEAA